MECDCLEFLRQTPSRGTAYLAFSLITRSGRLWPGNPLGKLLSLLLLRAKFCGQNGVDALRD